MAAKPSPNQSYTFAWPSKFFQLKYFSQLLHYPPKIRVRICADVTIIRISKNRSRIEPKPFRIKQNSVLSWTPVEISLHTQIRDIFQLWRFELLTELTYWSTSLESVLKRFSKQNVGWRLVKADLFSLSLWFTLVACVTLSTQFLTHGCSVGVAVSFCRDFLISIKFGATMVIVNPPACFARLVCI